MSTISIIMPVKNAMPYLEDCILSILAQSYTDWELIAVDDNSTDASLELIDSMCYRDPRVKVLKNKGDGIIPSLQTGYNAASGSHISRMDADDLMPPDKLHQLLDHWKIHGLGHVITGKVQYFAAYEIGEGYKKYEHWLNELTIHNNNFTEIYRECPIASPNWLIHHKDFEIAGGFDSDLYPEDYDLVFRWRAAGLKVVGIDKVTHKWRDSKNRASRTDKNYADNRFTALKIHYFLKQDYSTSKTLVLWGAGKKGKAIAKELNAKDIPFRWITNNERKVGHKVYEVLVESTLVLKDIKFLQCIIAVSQLGAREEILRELNKCNPDIYHFFC